VHNSMMTDGYIASYHGTGFLVSAMDASAILDVHLVADPYTIHISSYHSVEPYAAFRAKYDISYYSSIRSNKTIVRYLGGNSLYR
jgi:hypothetical protein